MRKPRSVVSKVLLPVIALLAIGGAVLTYLNYNLVKENTKEILVNNAINVVAQTDRQFESLFNSLSTTLAQLSEVPAIQGIEENEAKGLKALAGFKKNNPVILNTYIQLNQGKLLLYPEQNIPDDYDVRESSWFTKAIEQNGEIVLTKPYNDAASGKLTMTVAKMVNNAEGKFLGVLAIDVDLSIFNVLLKNTEIGKTGYTFLLDETGLAVYHPNKDTNGKDISSEKFIQRIITSNSNNDNVSYEYQGDAKELYFVKNKTTGLYIVGVIPLKEFATQASAHIEPMLIILGSIVIVIATIFYFVIRRMLRPLKDLSTAMDKVKAGDFSISVDVYTSDEIGSLTNGFNHMLEQVRKMLSTIAESSGAVMTASNTLVISVNENASAIAETSTAMDKIANDATTQADLVERDSSNLSLLSEKMEEVIQHSVEIRTSSEAMLLQTDKGYTKVVELRKQSAQTNTMTNEMVGAIKLLENNSNNISEIILTIQELADQTNLLALNAAIEAARAGESGRGFAVVADEVRKLAEKSAQSSKEIAGLIQQMQSQTKNTVGLIENTHELVKAQDVTVNEAESAFQAIEHTTKQNGQNINDVVTAIAEMITKKEEIIQSSMDITAITQETAANTEEVSASIEEQAASMEQMNDLANKLGEQAEKLINEFKNLKR